MTFTKAEKRILRGYCCAWCDQPADSDSCGAIWPPKCSAETRRKRAESALKHHKEKK